MYLRHGHQNALQQYDTASFYHAFGTILVWVLILLTAVLLRVGGVIKVEISRLYRLTTACFTMGKLWLTPLYPL